MKSIKTLVITLSVITLFVSVYYVNNSRTTDDIRESKAATSTPPNFKVAFIGDSGDDNNFQAVLNLIKAEGSDMVIHEGDFSYGGLSPWNNMINSTLGSNFPYFGPKGNHDSWSTYWPFFSSHISGSGATVVDGGSSSDTNYTLKYGGITMAFVGDGGSSSWDGYASYINTQLSKSDSIWKICNWHQNGVKDNTTSPGPRAMTSTGEKPNQMGTQVYETCRQLGAIIAQSHEHSYSRTKTVTKFVERTSSGGAIQVNNSLSADNLEVKPGSTFVLTSGLGGHSSRDFNCDFHDNDSWWASIYTRNHYMKSGNTQKKDCTVTGSGQYGNVYNTNIYPAGGINKYTYGALFITFNVDGDPKKARGYFKNIDGQTVDSFTIYADSSGPVVTPTSTPKVSITNTPSPTPRVTNTSTPSPKPTTPPTSFLGDCNTDGTINILDFQLLSNSFGKSSGQSGYNSKCDFNSDSSINILDFQILSNNFGKTGPTPTPTRTSGTLINENFSSSPNFSTQGGTWNTVSGRYELTSASTASTTHLNNRSLHNTIVNGDFTLEAEAKSISQSNYDDFAIIFGYQDNSNYYFASFNEQNDSGTSGIFKVVSGTSTQIADITQTISAGTSYTIKIERQGSSIRVYRNGILVANANDSAFVSGKVGFGTKDNKASFDNLSVR